MHCRDWRGGFLAAALFVAAGVAYAADSQAIRRDSVPRLLRAIEFGDWGSSVVRFGDLNGDGQIEALVVQEDSTGGQNQILVTCLTAIDLEGKSGKQKRQVQLAGGYDCLLFADLTGSGRAQQMVVKDRYSNFWVYDAAQDFKLLWSQAKVITGHYPINYDFNGVPMALRAAKDDESRVELCGMLLYGAGGRGRYRSGSVEAVTEFGPEHVREPINVRGGPGRGSGSTKGCVTTICVFSASAPETTMNEIIAGIDVHKRVLMVVVGTVSGAAADDGSEPREPIRFVQRKFGTTTSELLHLLAWLQQHGAREVVMESTAQYWKPVWLALERNFRLHLAQAWSNRAPRGKKADFKDAKRLVRRYAAGELTLSFVPEAEQRQMRTVTRRRTQLTRQRVRIQNQLESLLEETRIKLSSVVTDLLGASGLRILTALGEGETDPAKLAAMGDARLQCGPAELADALTGSVSEIHRRRLQQHLAQLALIDAQMEELSLLAADAMRQHSDAVMRLVKIPGIRVLAAQQIVAEAGPRASAFPSAAQFSSWIGVCPGREESAGENHSSRCAKGNTYMRRVLCQAAQAAVKTKNSYFQQKFQRLMPKLGYAKAIWAMARHISVVIWKILHDGAQYEEHGLPTTPQAAKRRVQRLTKQLRALGYSIELKPLIPEAVVV